MKNKRIVMLFVSLFTIAPAVFGGTIGEKRGRFETATEARDCDGKVKFVAQKAKPAPIRGQGDSSTVLK